jgi:hypothetical protein
LLCCCCSCCWGVINQITAIFANFVQFHHSFVIAQIIALFSYFTMHSAALLGSLARQPCPAALTGSLDQVFDQFRLDLMHALRSHRTVLQWQVTKLHARAAVLTGLNLLPALVRTYNAGLSFALLLFFFFLFMLGSQTLLKILHYCPISPCFQHISPLPAALPGSLARQPCPGALPASLGEKRASCFTAVGRHACSIAYF